MLRNFGTRIVFRSSMKWLVTRSCNANSSSKVGQDNGNDGNDKPKKSESASYTQLFGPRAFGDKDKSDTSTDNQLASNSNDTVPKLNANEMYTYETVDQGGVKTTIIKKVPILKNQEKTAEKVLDEVVESIDKDLSGTKFQIDPLKKKSENELYIKYDHDGNAEEKVIDDKVIYRDTLDVIASTSSQSDQHKMDNSTEPMDENTTNHEGTYAKNQEPNYFYTVKLDTAGNLKDGNNPKPDKPTDPFNIKENLVTMSNDSTNLGELPPVILQRTESQIKEKIYPKYEINIPGIPLTSKIQEPIPDVINNSLGEELVKCTTLSNITSTASTHTLLAEALKPDLKDPIKTKIDEVDEVDPYCDFERGMSTVPKVTSISEFLCTLPTTKKINTPSPDSPTYSIALDKECAQAPRAPPPSYIPPNSPPPPSPEQIPPKPEKIAPPPLGPSSPLRKDVPIEPGRPFPMPIKLDNMETEPINEIEQRIQFKRQSVMLLEDVPGPFILKFIAKIWKVIPFFSSQLLTNFYTVILDAERKLPWQAIIRPSDFFFKKYGSIVHFPGPLGGNVIMLSRPDHMETVFKQEAQQPLPLRSCLDSVDKYRKIFTTSTDNISINVDTIQSKVEPSLTMLTIKLHDQLEICSGELVDKIHRKRNRRDEVPKNFMGDILKWSLECHGYLLYSTRFGYLAPKTEYQMPRTEEERLFEALKCASSAIQSCERGIQFWRLFETPNWKKLVDNMGILDNINGKYIRQAQMNIRSTNVDDKEVERRSLPLIEHLIIKENLAFDDLLTAMADMLIIGVNSVASVLAFGLYNLAMNPRSQKKLIDELMFHMPDKESNITPESLTKMKYLNACVLETLRLNPPLPYMIRITQEDLEINAYTIPKETQIIMANKVACLREENFLDAEKFKPERWLNESLQQIHPFAAIPFGYGRRACIAKSFAQTQLSLTIAKIARNYLLEYHYGDIRGTNTYISMPNRSLRLKFIDRY